MKNIAVFASGSGTNAENIIRHFERSDVARVALIFSDNPQAYVLQRAEQLGIPVLVVPRGELRTAPHRIVELLAAREIDFIVLAGFLSLVPHEIIDAYRGRVVNVHPALLPAYGGKGMYGMHVHCAVLANKERESGITIHHVDEIYDNGNIIAQYRCDVAPQDTPETLAAKIHALEHEHLPQIIEQEIKNNINKKKL
ncbi:MAG: phosphoribosylglycinamide formyltransferase [Rikenellaceae bacterium]|nr:phosphoribosylglycinamide formyltransferase [Rikenellaceae bacterium]MCL2693105.1 phosphoribosylglycinamide formyltransferase [Rikenellaceae bacterium]